MFIPNFFYSLYNFYNSLPVVSPSRYTLFVAIVRLSASVNEMQSLQSSISQLDTLLSSWSATPDQKRDLYIILADSFEQCGMCVKSTLFSPHHLYLFFDFDVYIQDL
jgi:hypothetical protein